MKLKDIFSPLARSVTAAALTTTLIAGAAHADVWRLSSMMPEDSFEGMAFTRFAELAEEYTEGRVEVRIYPNEQLGKIDTVLDQLRDGTIQLAPTQVGFLSQYVPEFVYTSAPFLFSDYEQWTNFMHGDLVQGWVDQVEETANIAILGDISALRRGSFRVMLTTDPMEGMSDLDGLTIRQYQDELVVNSWSHLGAEVRIIPWTDTYDAVNRGIVDGLTSPAELVEANRFYEVAPHITRTNEFPQAVTFMMNADAFAALSPEDQEALERAQMEASEYGVSLVDEQSLVWEARMEELGAILNMDFPIDEMVAKVAEYYDELAATGELPAGLMDAVAAAQTE
ncbi:MAG: TRAP transporter substrate-binding protein [Pseudomonadota bacterium]|nr:TRAP transporter substrate-binding protein [Pseudomonadota bacterium]